MSTILQNIPQELRELSRWVCANADSKMPMRAYESKQASVTKPDTWGDFDEVTSCVEDGIYEFAGFVFADDGYVGIDIDHAFDNDGLLTEDAIEAVQICKSYTEVSKSGDGLHIICRGELPFKGRNNRKGWEIYKTGRYFLLTGSCVLYRDIVDAQSGIDAILDKHFSNANESSSQRCGDRIWGAKWRHERTGMVMIEPERETVSSGSRHISMVSYCGQLHTCLAHRDFMLEQALATNERYMDPPLDESEIVQIVDSVARYAR